ncbi:MAG TPA: choice-of-anchor tandem repeat GloVer-containing protein [Rhizomicrobium sp.]
MLLFTKSRGAAHITGLLGATAAAMIMVSAACAHPSHGVKVKYLFDFAVSQNAPGGALVQGQDGNMYGVENYNDSEIFEISPGGNEAVLWNSQLQTEAGAECYSGMALGTDGLLYGTCWIWNGNENASGIVFRFDPSQQQNGFTILYTWPAFGNGNSEKPSGLTLGTDGNFYGTTRADNANPFGTVFKVTPAGNYTTIHVFAGGVHDGALPSIGGTEEGYPEPLTLGSDGNFYGTTDGGGSSKSSGTVYRVTPAGAVTILHSFQQRYGTYTGVVELDGDLYGQTTLGGPHNNGTIYKLASDGTLSTLHNFAKKTDKAAFPDFPFTIGSDGNLYDVSTDYIGGGFGPESLYAITPAGIYSDLYSKFGVPTGCEPEPIKNGCEANSPLLLHTNGIFYGLTMKGPDNNEGGGAFYVAELNQAPFVRPLLPAAKPGQWMGILGQHFSHAKEVSFGRTKTVFRVVSDTYMEARLPPLAAKGKISVTTAGGELSSNIEVTPLR